MTSQVATTGDDCSRPRSGREAKQVSPCQAELQAASHQPPDPFVVRWCAARRGDEAPKALPVAGNLQACAVCLAGRWQQKTPRPCSGWLVVQSQGAGFVGGCAQRLRAAGGPPCLLPASLPKRRVRGSWQGPASFQPRKRGWSACGESSGCFVSSRAARRLPARRTRNHRRAAAGLGTPSCCQVRLKASRHLPALLRCQAFSRQGPADPGLAIAAPRRCAAWRELGAPANQRQPPRCCGGGGKRIMESAAEFWAIESRRNSCERRAQPRGGGGEGQPAKTF